jgi:hypothetical protein
MTYRDVWRVRGAWSLSRKRGNDTGEQQRECEAEGHCAIARPAIDADSISANPSVLRMMCSEC